MSIWEALAAPFTAPTQGFVNVLNGVTGQSASDANAQNIANAKDAFEASQGSADKQMAFQERMSNTSYQRAMADMKAAGLNPMLAFSQGGANTPTGASASQTAAVSQDVGGSALKNISALAQGTKDIATLPSAISQMKAQTQQSNAMTAQTEQLTPVQAKKVQSEANLNNATAAKTAAETIESEERTKYTRKNQDKIAEEIKNLVKSGKINDLSIEQQNRINEWIKHHPNFFRAKQVIDSISPFTKAYDIGQQHK